MILRLDGGYLKGEILNTLWDRGMQIIITCRLFAVTAEGLSMVEENIMPEDIIICDADAKLKDGDMAIVRLGEKVTLKRVRFKGNYLELRAGNKGFEPIKAKKNKIKIVGEIIYHIEEVMESFSAKKPGRPKFMEMIKRVK